MIYVDTVNRKNDQKKLFSGKMLLQAIVWLCDF